MTKKRNIEVFSAGCPLCTKAIDEIKGASCDSCEIEVVDVNDPENYKRADSLNVKTVPAVAIDGILADCCSGRGVDIHTLKNNGLGKS